MFSIQDKNTNEFMPEISGIVAEICGGVAVENGNKSGLRKVRKRILGAACLFLAMLVLITGNTAKVQLIDGVKYKQWAIAQQTRDKIINSKRGTIYDRNMKPLAVSATVYTVVVSPSEICKVSGRAEKVSKLLADTLKLEYEEVYKKVSKTSSDYEEIKAKIEKDESDALFAIMKDLPGVTLLEDSKRYYPFNNFASHVIGFTGKDNQGLSGIEYMYDEFLTGKSGRVVSAADSVGGDMPYKYEKYYNSEDGLSVVLTIDEVIQHFVEKHLETAVIENDVKNGAAALVMDVKTGEILAMAIKPDFDLNQPFEITDAATVEVLEEIKKTDEEEYVKQLGIARNKMWKNKAVSDTYEPGSTFKIITSAIALEENLVNVTDSFYCSGVKNVSGSNIHCWKSGGHGMQSFSQAIQNSCNPAFMDIGARVGATRFSSYTSGFGLRSKTGIDLPGEESGVFFQPNVMGPVEVATTSFGQGFQVTPIQLISAVSAVVNDGKYMKPHVVKSLLDSDGNIVEEFEGEFVKQVVSKETSEILQTLLEDVVSVGSGKNAYVEGYRIGGKTGTSEKQPRSEGKKIASMVGFAPANDPQIAVLVLLDEPEGGQYFGGVIAGPLMGSIMEDILPYLGVSKTFTSEESEQAGVSIPEIVGLTRGEALAKAGEAGFTLNLIGDGETVVSQIPKSSARLKKGASIYAYTTEQEPEMLTVPDVSNMSLLGANTALINSGFNMKLTGTQEVDGEAVIFQQDPAAGTKAAKGTVVYVKLRHLGLE